MTFIPFAALPTTVAVSADKFFSEKVRDITFITKEKGCAALQKITERGETWYLWYWCTYQELKWKQIHMLRGENWLGLAAYAA